MEKHTHCIPSTRGSQQLQQKRVSPTLDLVPDGNKHPSGTPPAPQPLIKGTRSQNSGEKKSFIALRPCKRLFQFQMCLLPGLKEDKHSVRRQQWSSSELASASKVLQCSKQNLLCCNPCAGSSFRSTIFPLSIISCFCENVVFVACCIIEIGFLLINSFNSQQTSSQASTLCK